MPFRTRNIALLSILIVTATLWFGVDGIGLTGDDYQYLQSLAPIGNFGDVFRPFVSPDANPSFFRPIANLTLAFDFLLFGWNGGGYHLTNLFLHLMATLLVFFFVRNLFSLRENEAVWATLAFGIAASHEMNIVWAAARADLLSAIFVMLALIFVKKSRDENSIMLSIGAWVSFAFALLSKESTVLALPLIGILCWKSPDMRGLKIMAARFFPYLIIATLFYFYHQHFAVSIAASQPLTAEGSHSIFVFLRNAVYSLGYFVLPLDLSTATTFLTRYREAMGIACGIIAMLGIWLLFSLRRTGIYRELAWPFVFTAFTGIVLAFTFERWRLYLPSAGLVAMLAIILRHTFSRASHIVWISLLIPVGAFHVYRTLAAESDWQSGTKLLESLKQDLSGILAKIPERPVRIGFLDVPAKLGGASVMQLGKNALLIRAEADRLSEFNRKTASTDGANVDAWTAVDVYALNSSEGFYGLEIKQIASDRYLVSVPVESDIALYPATLTSNVTARRDFAMHVGDSISESASVDIVRSASFGIAKSIEVRVLDSSAVLMSFNGRSFENTRKNMAY